MDFKNKNQSYLLASNVALVFFLILLSNLGLLPFGKGDFIFFAALTFLVALFRPSWTFLFFVGTIMLETVNLAPTEWGIAVRPYQLLGGLTIMSLCVRFFTRRLNFPLIRLNLFDWAALALAAGSFLSVLGAPAKGASLKQAIIMATFVAFYFLARNFLQNREDVKKVLPFFIDSSIVVVLYGLWQNVRFLHVADSFEFMPGRPNSTFTEPDWFGIFLVFLLAAAYCMIYYFQKQREESSGDRLKFSFHFSASTLFLFLFLVLIFTVLIITVARSAWLGTFFVTVIFLFSAFTQLKFDHMQWQWKETIMLKIQIISALILSILLVYMIPLTNFQLGNRFQSTGSGQQKITVSCSEDKILENKIWDEESLQRENCHQINLEDVEKEKAAGSFVQEVYRKDPNVSIRSEIYRKSWEIIKTHPILGIGWGSIGSFLGTDPQGNKLNASNIFLETWLGAGLIGLAAFVFLLFGALKNGLYFFVKEDNFFGLFIILGTVAIVVPNLFNSGIFLGFIWLFLGASFIKK